MVLQNQHYKGLEVDEIERCLADWWDSLLTIAYGIYQLTQLSDSEPELDGTASLIEMLNESEGKLLDLWNSTPVLGCPYKFFNGKVQIMAVLAEGYDSILTGRHHSGQKSFCVKCPDLFDDEDWHDIWFVDVA